MSYLYNYIFVLILTIGGRYTDALECFSCDHVNSVSSCTKTDHCSTGQSCYVNASSSGYRLGCIDNQQCSGHHQAAASLVGRSHNLGDDIYLDQRRRDLYSENKAARGEGAKRATNDCFECCSSAEMCNRNLCDHFKPTVCIDDYKVDCALMNSLFDVCKNVHEAKAVCPKFCGLCSLVDGDWTEWSAWSGCDVSCANGTQSRTRTCTNPTPVAGGLECPGSAKESKTCSLQHCPVDGLWTEWSTWSLCDVTCENGTQTRTRTCSNPVPAYSGHNCTGNSVDTKRCMKELCPVHGGWTQWYPWEPCSVTCDYGIQRRHRNCTNPTPERFGDHCFGDSSDDRICQPGPCANGGWSAWGTWSSCSTTCGGGMMSRSRTCTNPRPSEIGRQCEGDPLQYISCNNDRCLLPTVAFRSKGLRSLSASHARTLVFTQTILNIGDGYNNNTGIFTAPVSGAYSFACQLCMPSGSGNVLVYAIVHNNQDIINGVLSGDHDSYVCDNFDAFAILRANDTVWVRIYGGGGSLYEDIYRWNMFTGMLVHD